MRSPYGIELVEDCIHCRFRSERFFCNLEPESLAAFGQLTFTTSYPSGSQLFVEGQLPRGIFVLCQGRVKLTTSASDGKTLITRVAEPGEVLGLSGAISGLPYKATAETLEPTVVNFIRRDDFIAFVQKYGEACFHASQQLSAECHIAHNNVRSLGLSHSAAEKLAHLIIDWCREGTRSDQGVRVKMMMTHQEISQMIGTSRETVTRTLSEFKQRKILTVRGSTLIVHDLGALESYVQL